MLLNNCIIKECKSIFSSGPQLHMHICVCCFLPLYSQNSIKWLPENPAEDQRKEQLLNCVKFSFKNAHVQ